MPFNERVNFVFNSASDKWNFPTVTNADNGLYLFGGGRQQDGARHDAKISQTVALVGVKLLGRSDQSAAVNDCPELIKNARIHKFHSVEWK